MSQAPPQNGMTQINAAPGMAIGMEGAAPAMEGDMQAAATDAGAPQTTKLSKVLHVEIKGTLNGFSAMGPTAATWKPVEGKHISIFGVNDLSAATEGEVDGSAMMNAGLTAATNSLKNVTITKATVLQSHNTFPVPLGVNVSCLPKNEICDTGDRYTFTTIPCTTVNTPAHLYEAGESQSQASEWRRNYSQYNAANLETQGVLPVDKSPYVFVNENHPVINLLRMNKQVLGVDVDKMTKMDGQWYKIMRALMQTSCDAIRTKILNKIATQDMTALNVQLHRVGGVDWGHVDSSDTLMSFAADPSWDHATLKANLQAHEYNFTEKPAVFMARIQVDYEMQK